MLCPWQNPISVLTATSIVVTPLLGYKHIAETYPTETYKAVLLVYMSIHTWLRKHGSLGVVFYVSVQRLFAIITLRSSAGHQLVISWSSAGHQLVISFMAWVKFPSQVFEFVWSSHVPRDLVKTKTCQCCFDFVLTKAREKIVSSKYWDRWKTLW
jgi:hypothetical protein